MGLVSRCELVCPGMGVLNGCLERLCENECEHSGQAVSAEVGLKHVGWSKHDESVTQAEDGKCEVMVGMEVRITYF